MVVLLDDWYTDLFQIYTDLFQIGMTFGPQERLSKEDIRLLIEAVDRCGSAIASADRIELLIGKLKRMEKQ